MTAILLFIVIAVVGSYWWLWRHRITEKPWATVGVTVDHEDSSRFLPPGKIGLLFFLAVVTSLFALFVSAYFIRMGLADWIPQKEPGLLWFNTFMLVLGSVAIQWASYSADHNDPKTTRYALLATGLFTGTFIVGQLWAWQGLVDQGLYMYSNPSLAFFYLFTGVHGLHIIGGLWVWCRTTLHAWSGAQMFEIRLSVELCKTYWHYLLLIWIGIFGLLLST
ncbi:MAG: cytochrome-c oxidase [bacterium]